ncbi:hypothetical protein V1264_003070 [Littorina saxatilis]|uniref:Uncharacterized protein n=1 Tax=Littorina saxatilis TaxID=31220 RepID=A0AAN9B3Z2_9CAEN
MDYRIFFVRTWSCACVYTRGCSDTEESLHTKLTLRNKSLAERGDELTLTAANWIQIQRAACFYNPPNSDMDYRIFFVRTWSCACVYTRGCSDTEESLHTKLTLRNKSLAERGDELTLTAANWIQIQRAAD